MSYMGDYKMRQAEEAEAAIGRAVDEAAAAEAEFEARREQAYADHREQQLEALYRNFTASAGALFEAGWRREDFLLALENELGI